MEFNGIENHGRGATRNFVAVIPTVGCVNKVANSIASEVEDARPFLHHQGCCQLSFDVDNVEKTLAGIANNPNVGAVLLVSLGCESTSSDVLQESINKPLHIVRLQESGFADTLSEGIKECTKLAMELNQKRVETDLSELTVGIKCGASDATSGIASNPAVGSAADMLVEMGAKVIFGETTEVLGAEHILSKRGINDEVSNNIMEKVREMEHRARSFGVDMRGGQPTGGNIKGGLTTIEEKSLGAIVKSGTKPIQGVLEYGEAPKEGGLYFMDSPGREMEFLTGVAAAGANVILFSTGLGAPQGFPIVPVIKISGNPNTCERLSEHIDVDVSPVTEGSETIEEAGQRIFEDIISVASGIKVKAELLGYDVNGVNSNIYTKGPVI